LGLAATTDAKGELSELRLGNIEIQRDWGWAPEYVQAMYLMLREDKPDDYVIAIGETIPLRNFVGTSPT
jgi:GDPmannose 4,6-dehydratase